MKRTLKNLKMLSPIYLDNCSWRFYEGLDVEQIDHDVRLEIVKREEDKIHTIIVHFTTNTEDMAIRLAPYEFRALNDMFKRASFRLEKI